MSEVLEGRYEFITPENFAREQTRGMESPRGPLLIAGCRTSSLLVEAVVSQYQRLLAKAGSNQKVAHLDGVDDAFTDSETRVRLDCHVGGCDVFLLQTLFDPRSPLGIDRHYMTFLIAARAFREHGASHVTGVLPYLAYARQDKPTKFLREPTTAKLMADLAIEAGIDRLITWNPHSAQIRGFYGTIPVNVLESLSFFIDEFHRFRNREDVIAVAPDAGASKLVTRFGRALGLRCAIASKFRPRTEEAEITEIIGDFTGKRVAIIIDDMISSGGTIDALVRKLVDEKGIEEVHLGVSHSLCVGDACERLRHLHDSFRLHDMVVTDSVPQTEAVRSLSFVTIRPLADTLSRTINRVHYNRSVSEIFVPRSL
ncbi:MAG: ribose-phosphate pyrophosphokinase [Acidobacteriota bacterium]|nr:MAG: ribose-phosphate pyrophosphokinase [Acidobacteriota bacterium]